MNRAWRVALLAAAPMLALTACDQGGGERTAGQQLDVALQRTEKAGAETVAKTREIAADARAQIQSGEMKERLQAAGAQVSAGFGDAAITAKVVAGFANDPSLNPLHIDVDTKNGVVSLRGTVSSESVKSRAQEIARSVDGVRSVDNAMTISAN
jgi:hyperosmotically inducible protein